MAGVTDLPFRRLCRQLGAGLVVGEMIASNPDLRDTRKSRQRLDHSGEPEPVAVQIAGGDPQSMADCARFAVANGAHIVDINMGCPAKKVCNKAAGSALMKDEPLVRDIIAAVVESVDVPVTLKMRTGWDIDHRNAPVIAAMAEQLGIQSLAVHGRTRTCGYGNTVEYDTIRTVKQAAGIPVFANGDIDSPRKAVEVMQYTGADGVLIGRAAQGNPWIFRQINEFLATGQEPAAIPLNDVRETLLSHLTALYDFYGDYLGVRIARKHVGWYLSGQPGGKDFRRSFNQLESTGEQGEAVRQFFMKNGNANTIAA
ncbi:tRNA dihydrouridine synthase DusB [Oceanobacter mangrovi]|uniref:tRNA dihydrouridine synthase DusB n=1 Tax=Oceanobacter mangrovi TaxID=2862510 RepID=UPI003CCE7AAA